MEPITGFIEHFASPRKGELGSEEYNIFFASLVTNPGYIVKGKCEASMHLKQLPHFWIFASILSH
jgi:hypothetical protein